MARLTKEELEKVKVKYGVDELYSWSKISTFTTSPYEFYLKYILKTKENLENCAYAPLGSLVHTCLERYYGKEIQYEDMIDEFQDGWLTNIDILDLKLDRNDEEKDKSIKQKYKIDIEHFFKNHKPIEHEIKLEKFLATKVGDYVLQGYLDAIYRDNEGLYTILDWKTSSKFSEKVLEEKSGQLCVYCMGLMQLGIPLKDIRCAFNMIKYCTVQYQQANGAVKTRDIERYKIGESLQSNLKVWLKKYGYEDQMDDYLKMVIDTNGIECLPQEVQDMYVISDCYVYVDLTERLLKKWEDEIVATIKDIEVRTADYNESHNERIWWDTEESVKSQSYYFATLSGYSATLHKPYAEYLKKLEAQQSGRDFFSGVGGALEDNQTNKVISNKADELDLSWLNDI